MHRVQKSESYESPSEFTSLSVPYNILYEKG